VSGGAFNFSECQLLSKQVRELECVLQFVQSRLAPQKVCLLGRSLGGATSILVAGRRKPETKPQLDGLALWSTPSDLPATFKNVLGPANFQKLSGGQDLWLEDERGKVLIQAAFVQEILQCALPPVLKQWRGKPLLILHGTDDQVVAPAQATAKFCCGGEPKQLVYIPGGDHSFTTQGEVAAATVLQWLRSWL
jgi:alpha-beta hydrolase superfamily lysophospholipase